jgi:hypothetical protein
LDHLSHKSVINFNASYGPDAGFNEAQIAGSTARLVNMVPAKGGREQKMIACRALADSKAIW